MPSYLSPDAYARTVYSNDRRGSDGSFSYEYETDNNIKAKQESTGYGANKVVRGYYSYIGADGVPYTVNYIADRFGYRASGAHLPTQPDAVYDQTKLPVYRPSNNPYYVSSTAAPPQVYPLQSQNYQHQTQTAYYPQSSLSTQPIYVTDSAPSNYINITPKPFNNYFPTSTQPPLSILPPYNNYISSSPEYSNSPYYNSGFSSTTSRPYVSY
jgi:Insect cuticle protein